MSNAITKILAWTWIITIAYLSLMSQSNPPADIDHVDKLLHLGSYGLATILIIIAYPLINKSYIVVLLFTYSFSMETAQLFIENRFFEIADLVANLSGILLTVYIFNKYLQPKKVDKKI